MIITLSGEPGSGKSTVARILENKLGFPRLYMGRFMRDLAKKKGITLEALNELCHDDPSIDKEADELLVREARKADNIIVESRTAWHFLPESFKVKISVDSRTGAERIFKDLTEKETDRNQEIPKSVEEMEELNIERMENEEARYRKHYGIKNIYADSNFDFIVDSTDISPEEVADMICDEFKERLS